MIDAKKFWSTVNKHGPVAKFNNTRCWVWNGCHNDQGYGVFGIRTKALRAHRVAWKLATGRWPSKHACHRCDVRDCVRASHLFNGSQKANMEDMASKQRSTLGEKHPCAKLRTSDVKRIRWLRGHGVSCKVLAAQYGVHSNYIYRLVDRSRWKHI